MFLTKYVLARDVDLFMLEGQNNVSMIPPKPGPIVFLSDFELPRDRNRDYFLVFNLNERTSLHKSVLKLELTRSLIKMPKALWQSGYDCAQRGAGTVDQDVPVVRS